MDQWLNLIILEEKKNITLFICVAFLLIDASFINILTVIFKSRILNQGLFLMRK